MELGRGLPASVAKMQAKAAQLAEELRTAKAHCNSSPKPNSSLAAPAATVVVEASETACISANSTASGPQQAFGLQQTPAVFRRLSQSNAIAAKSTATFSDMQQMAALQCQKLEAEVQLWKCKHFEAVKELDRRQESYMRREDHLKAQLAALTQPQDMPVCEEPGGEAGNSSSAESSTGPGDVSSAGTASPAVQKAPKPATLQEMQEQVLHGLDDLLQRQRLQMRTEEAQQLRQFRSRLAEIEGQLQACKQAAAEHQGDWMEKTLTLREELARTQEIASKLDAMYKLAEEEAAQLRVQFRAQEDDRQHLVRQLIAAKRENSRLKQEHTALQDEVDAIMALALEAEAGEAAPLQAGGVSASLWVQAAQDSTARDVRHSSNSSLAAAITEVVGRRGSSTASHIAQGGSLLSRPATAGPVQQQQQTTKQLVRPWSAVSAQQHGHAKPGESAGSHVDSATIAAKMERYGHVIQKLQKLLESERRQLRQLRSNYTAELGRRNELQSLMLDTIQQAKEQYREAESACLAQQRQAARKPLWTMEEQRHQSAAVTASRPSSTPAGATVCSAHSKKCTAGLSRPCSAASASPWSTAVRGLECRPLDLATWQQLLHELLAKQEVLELLFGCTFPDFLNESEELYGAHKRQQVSEQLQPTIVHWMRQLWGSKLQQHQQPVDAHATAGLGETSPTGSLHDEGILDDRLMDSDREDGDGSKLQAEAVQAVTSAASLSPQQQQVWDKQLCDAHHENPASTDVGVSVGSSYSGGDVIADTSNNDFELQGGCSADEHVSASLGYQHHQHHQQLHRQQLDSGCLASADITLGAFSSPVMPSFPARQPLHKTIVRRPWSGAAQQFPDAAGSSLRPNSAAVSSNARKVPRQNHTRPATAAGSLPSTETPEKQTAVGRKASATAAAVDTGHWRTAAARITASFLSNR